MIVILISAITIILNIIIRYYFNIKNRSVELLIATFFLVLFYLSITETNDSKNYEYLYYNLKKSPDIGWTLMTNFAKLIKDNYVVNIWLYYLLGLYFFIKILKFFSYYPLFVILNLQIFTMLFNINQIRYFLSFYIFIYSLIMLGQQKKKVFFVLFLLSLIFHKSIIVLYLAYLFIQLSKYRCLKELIKLYIKISILVFLLWDCIILIIEKVNFLAHYKVYLVSEKKLSFKGWIFSILFVIIWYIYIYILNKQVEKILKQQNRKSTMKLNFLLKLVFIGIIFIPISIRSLDILQRYALSFHVMNLIYLTYVIKFFKKNERIKILGFTMVLSLINYFYYFEIPVFIGLGSQKLYLLKIYNNLNLYNIIEKI